MSLQTKKETIIAKLLNFVKGLYETHFKNKKNVPKTLNKLSKDFLVKFPNNVFFKAIEIKSFEEKADKDLDDCFPGDFFPDENDEFTCEIFECLFQNIKNFEKNDIIIKSLKNIINTLKSDSMIRKYVNLINIIIKDFDDENKLLCHLLVSNPLKYNELIILVNINIKLSPLPKSAVDFYALKNYNNNIDKFSQFNDPIENLRKEILTKIDSQNEIILSQAGEINQLKNELSSQAKTIDDLNKEITDLKKDSKTVKYALFQVQVRDIIKAFVNNIFWCFHINKTFDDILDVKEELIGISGIQNDGVNTIMNILINLKNLKNSGDDQGHYVNNIGFDESILPEEIRQKYAILKGKTNCGIKDCDCIALILSIKEVNDSTIELTKKKYDLLKNILDIPVKDWEKNKLKVQELLNSY